jgi:hypothetical protein
MGQSDHMEAMSCRLVLLLFPSHRHHASWGRATHTSLCSILFLFQSTLVYSITLLLAAFGS